MRLAGFPRLRRVGFAPKVPVMAACHSSLTLKFGLCDDLSTFHSGSALIF